MVGPADAEDGHLRAERLDELDAAARQAAVVRYFDDSNRRGLHAGHEFALDCASDIASKHHRHGAPPELEYNRIVVPHLLTLPVGGTGVVDDEVDTVDADARTAI